MFLSKMTAATLEDIEYIVDSSMVRFDPQYGVVPWNVQRRLTMVAIYVTRKATPRYFTAGRHLIRPKRFVRLFLAVATP